MDLTFGEKLKEARKTKQLTQKQLADKIGAKHNSVSDWENNKNKPDPDTIELLCGVLDITPNYLLSSEPSEFSPVEKLLIQKYRSLDSFGQETVNMILEHELTRMGRFLEKDRTISNLQNHLSLQTTNITALSDMVAAHRMISYYHHMASAGTGEYLFDDIPTELISVPDSPIARQADFVLGVNGDSMEPTFQNGDNVFVEKTDIVKVGEIGIFFIGNECFIKEAGSDGLISHNPKYPLIPGSESIRCVGRVLGKVEKL